MKCVLNKKKRTELNKIKKMGRQKNMSWKKTQEWIDFENN